MFSNGRRTPGTAGRSRSFLKRTFERVHPFALSRPAGPHGKAPRENVCYAVAWKSRESGDAGRGAKAAFDAAARLCPIKVKF